MSEIKSEGKGKSTAILDRVYAEQHKMIEKRYGKRAADEANYGWGANEGSIATKVYLGGGSRGVGNMVLQTGYDPRKPVDQKLDHRWSEY